jgi:hypothetical protein
MHQKPRVHRWLMLEIGESITVALPIIDLVHVQERLAREANRVFSLRQIDTPADDDTEAQYTIVTRMM